MAYSENGDWVQWLEHSMAALEYAWYVLIRVLFSQYQR